MGVPHMRSRLTKEESLHPKHSRQQVLTALQRGQEVLVAYSPALQGVSIDVIR